MNPSSQSFDKTKVFPFVKVLVGTAALLWIMFLISQVRTPWDWSLLMDDWWFHHRIESILGESLLDFVHEQVSTFFRLGRFVPIYASTIAVLWKAIPQDPRIFHLFTTLLFIGLFLGAGALVLREFSVPKTARVIVFALLSLIFIGARPILDAATFITIPEPWVGLSVIIGLAFFQADRGLYRIFFIVAVFYKEPALAAFLASSIARVVGKRSAQNYVESTIDLVLFLVGALLINHFRMSGTYRAGNSFF